MTKKKQVNQGEIFTIELKGNVTTGYNWVLAKLPSNLYLVSEQYIDDPHAPGMVGFGGTKIFIFKAMGTSVEEELLVFKEIRLLGNRAHKEEAWKVDVIDKIGYEHITDYFVRNDAPEGEQFLVLQSKEEFDKWFHPAPVMYTKQRWIGESDFKSNYVFALIEPAEKMESSITLEDLDVKADVLEIDYTLKKEPIEFTVRWAEILLIEKASYQEAAFIENGKRKKVVPV